MQRSSPDELMVMCTKDEKRRVETADELAVFKRLFENRKLSLSIENYDLSPAAVDMIVEHIRKHDDLNGLTLDGVCGEDYQGPEKGQLLTPVLNALAGAKGYLLDLSLSNCPLEATALVALLNSHKCDQLETLNIEYNCFSDADLYAVTQALQNAQCMNQLTLDGNIIGALSARGLAKAIRRMENLKYLGLSDCGIGITEMRVLAESLKFSENLEMLSLKGNKIKKCLQQVGDAVGALPSLLELDMSYCEMGSRVMDFVKSLENCKNLSNLNLSYNRIKFDKAKKLCVFLDKALATLNWLNLNGNSLNESQKDELNGLFRKQHVIAAHDGVSAPGSDNSRSSDELELSFVERINDFFKTHELEKLSQISQVQWAQYFSTGEHDPKLILKLITVLSKFLKSSEQTVFPLTKMIFSAFFQEFSNPELFSIEFLKFFGFFQSDVQPVVTDDNLKKLFLFIDKEKLISEDVKLHMKEHMKQFKKPPKGAKEELAMLDVNFELELCFNPHNKVMLTIANGTQLKA